MTDGKPHPQLRALQRFALGLLLVAVVVAIWGIHLRQARQSGLVTSAHEAAIPVVRVVHPKHSQLADQLVLPGTVQAFIDAPIYARTSGYLQRWYADIGAHVKRGQLLAVIETPEVDAQYRQAKADLAAAQATYQLAKITTDRYEKLRPSGLVSLQDADNAKGDAAAKKAQLESAKQNLERLQQLEDFDRIVAPFDGVVTARRIDVGALINAGASSGQELFHMTSTRRMRIYIEVPEAYSSLIRPGLVAQLSLVERPDQLFPATVVSTARAIDTSTRTLLTELQADNEQGELLPGAYAQVHLPLPAGAGSWRLPANALLFRADGLHVATVDSNGRVELKSVRVGRDFGTQLEILSGVDGTDRVILSPPDSIMSGQRVSIYDDPDTRPQRMARTGGS